MVPFILPYDLDLCKITFLAVSRFLMGKTLPIFFHNNTYLVTKIMILRCPDAKIVEK